MAFDGYLRPIDGVESGEQMLVQRFDIMQRYGRRTSSSVMYLRDFPTLIEVWQQDVQLLMQGLKIGFHGLIFRHRQRVAAAIVAQMPAERHMDVERKMIVGCIVGGFYLFYIGLVAERFEAVGRWIACITRHRRIVFL